jgi:hypothetical protein
MDKPIDPEVSDARILRQALLRFPSGCCTIGKAAILPIPGLGISSFRVCGNLIQNPACTARPDH